MSIVHDARIKCYSSQCPRRVAMIFTLIRSSVVFAASHNAFGISKQIRASAASSSATPVPMCFEEPTVSSSENTYSSRECVGETSGVSPSKSRVCDSNSSRAGGIGVDASTIVVKIGNFLRTSSCASFGGTASRSVRHVHRARSQRPKLAVREHLAQEVRGESSHRPRGARAPRSEYT